MTSPQPSEQPDWQPEMTNEVQKAIAYIREQDDFGLATQGTLIAMVRAVAEAAIRDVERIGLAAAPDPVATPPEAVRLLRAIANSADTDGSDADPDLIDEARRFLEGAVASPPDLEASREQVREAVLLSAAHLDLLQGRASHEKLRAVLANVSDYHLARLPVASPAPLDALENFAGSGYCPGCKVAIDLHPWLEDDPDAIRCPKPREALDALYARLGQPVGEEPT